ncbi:alpha/beta fold hydrolase [Pseudoroseicyclus sp. CXY001]|uniref:alpha/beta fold hydrolase n=1 Tax=Pseudoroseicyclus sp. CXY001 TaxID=3242492 RepID=UPI0035714AFD
MPTFPADDGTEIFFTDEGSGPPLLCLAGLTRNGEDFAPILPHLKAVRIIRMDARGRGRSAHADWRSYNIAQEARDVLTLLAHLALPAVGVLGTSRGGLVALALAAAAKDRLLAVALNDIGPEIMPEGLAVISGYLGRRPTARTLEAAAASLSRDPAFPGVPMTRWMEVAAARFAEGPGGLALRYDPALRDAVLGSERTGEAGDAGPPGDGWSLFAALDGLPLALIRGVNSDILAPEVADEMARRRPDMIRAEVPDRGHVPFLDEPEALAALSAWQEEWA